MNDQNDHHHSPAADASAAPDAGEITPGDAARSVLAIAEAAVALGRKLETAVNRMTVQRAGFAEALATAAHHRQAGRKAAEREVYATLRAALAEADNAEIAVEWPDLIEMRRLVELMP